MDGHTISFSFGKNWKDFIEQITEEQVEDAMKDILEWLGHDNIHNKSIIDIGSGSGIHSLAFFRIGAKNITSFDFDPYSVEASTQLWKKAGEPSNWKVFQGSILDYRLLKQLGVFDVVYSWGVLHHTGDMYKAIENAALLVDEGGYLYISIYAKGPNYENDLNLKRKYNKASPFRKHMMEMTYILKYMAYRAFYLKKNPFSWNQKKIRGMDTYHDIIDWLGGLPYEVASEDEILRYCSKLGLILERIFVRGEHACNYYVFRRPPHSHSGRI